MDPSPLTQDVRPESFQPKVAQLYERLLFHDDESFLPSEGFWREFFLLRPDKAWLVKTLDSISPEDLLHFRASTQNFFSRSIREAAAGRNPQSVNAFETLTAFLGGVLTKRYTNPSSDVIDVLAGLDEVDVVISGLVNAIDGAVRNTGSEDVNIRGAAIRTALSLTAGAYQTGIVSYFTHKDLFPALMKYVHDCEDPAAYYEPFLLLGLLANYNKFEMQNPYQLRLDDFVNEDTIQRLVRGIGVACITARNHYIHVQDDLPEGWNLNSTLIFLRLRTPGPEDKAQQTALSEPEAKELFGALPKPDIAIALPTYSFVNANKLFATNLTTLPAPTKSSETPFSAFLSLTSYLVHHAYRSQRCLHYSLLNLLTLQIISEDNLTMKRLSASDVKIPVRLCRQRAPHLPLVTSDRLPITATLDICTATLSHNLRKRLDIPLYGLTIGIILRIVTYLSRNKIRISHHWAYIWGSLISLIRFLTQYAPDLSYLPDIRGHLCTPLTSLTAFCLSAGDSFLPDPASYDDLFYKLVEAGPILTKFRDSYDLASITPSSATSTTKDAHATHGNHSISTLIQISSHYHDLLASSRGNKPHQSPAAVAAVIKQGYETLDIPSTSDFGQWTPWRESAWKSEMKRITRTVVDDSRRLVVGR